ncbi:MAG TPA: EAL domain-containing protein [Gallionella sp.]|nr:EAL domain-containing protein [Gallionella sp.]
MRAPLPPNEAQRLEALRGYHILDTLPEQDFDDLTFLAQQICQTPIALISLVDENRQWFKSKVGVSHSETSLEFAFCPYAILDPDKMLIVQDAQKDPRFAESPRVTGGPKIRFYAGAPLVTHDGLALGTLCVIDRVPRDLTAEQKTSLHALSRIVITQLEMRRNLDMLRLSEKQLESLNSELEQKVEARTADLRIAAAAFDAQESLMITDPDGVILRVNKAFTETTGYTPEEVVGKTPQILKSGHHNQDFYQAMWETLNRTGTWRGEIWDRRKNGEIYPKWLSITSVRGNNGLITHYVGSHIDITERKASEEMIQQLAFYDPLTSLPNRRLLLDRLQQALASSARSGREGALLFIDLDNFKNLNDTLGHDFGDMLLQQVTQRLVSCIREGDTVARQGGDEFVVMLVDLSEQPIEAAAQAEAIGEKILTALCKPYQLGTHNYLNTASIGITLFHNHEAPIEELMKQADIAMYQAKRTGRNALRFFDPQMQVSITARVALEEALRNALEKQQFELYYQVQVDHSQGEFRAEALIRWLSPERGVVPPLEFIPLAEETGQILPIGQWVLEAACAQIKAWQQDALTRKLVLSVNVSVKQFRQPDFADLVKTVIQRHAINPRLLKLELTESLLLENIEDTIATMNTLNETGVLLSMDDFGTGYSSLQYLRQLPLEEIKIPMSFIRNIVTNSNDESIVRTIIAMARSLNIGIIAEGVETEKQRLVLLKNGCTRYQGYLFSKPVPVRQFEELLKQIHHQ